jgi:hypothetical protein
MAVVLEIHSDLQMAQFPANRSPVSYSKQMKSGEYKQGRMH